jgi:glucose-1-phosphate thymidylyltransferase
LHVEQMGRGTAWLDSGTPDSLIDAAAYVRALENRQGERICCPEVIAFEQGFITVHQLAALGGNLGKSGYGQYLLRVADENI